MCLLYCISLYTLVTIIRLHREHQSSSKGRYSPPAYNALDPVEVPFKSDWYRHSPFHSTFSQNGVYPHAFSAQVELEPNMQKMMRKYEDECSDKMSTGEKGQVYLLQLPSSLKGCCVKGATSGSTGGDSATNSTDASGIMLPLYYFISFW